MRRLGQTCGRAVAAGLVLAAMLCASAAVADNDKPPLAPDTVPPFATESHIAATIEFGLPALAAEIERSIPRRLATIDEQVSCVHRRVFIFRVNANCDIWGHVDRTGPVALFGRGDRLYGSVPIYAVIEGQGANRFTSRIHGDTEARVNVEIEARPELNRDWSLNLNVSDGFHWSEAPILHVLGRNIPVARYAEPKIREQLANVRGRVAAEARRLDLRGKAEKAWRQVSEPLAVADNPPVWLQFKPEGAAFAGVRANTKVMWGSLEYTGTLATSIGDKPSANPAPLPPLGRDVNAAGGFQAILPIRIAYDVIRDNIEQLLKADASIREVQVYPSSGKLVIGLRVASAADTDPNAEVWRYLAGQLEPTDDGHAAKLGGLVGIGGDEDPALKAILDPLLAALHDKASLDFSDAYQNLLSAANKKLNRPLADGFRLEGQVSTLKLEKLYLPAEGVLLTFRATGELKIAYGL